jgi:hypothetical protein
MVPSANGELLSRCSSARGACYADPTRLRAVSDGGRCLDIRVHGKRDLAAADRAPSPDHYPRVKSDVGHLIPENVRLSHVLCNRVDYGWRMRIRTLIGKGRSLEEIAGVLNRRRVPTPQDTDGWSAASVRQAFVS